MPNQKQRKDISNVYRIKKIISVKELIAELVEGAGNHLNE